MTGPLEGRATPDLAVMVDVPSSVLEWAIEAMLNDGDGYWGGAHNFYIYDQGAAGYVWIPDDMDATFDFLGNSTGDPIYWWSTRSGPREIGQHYLHRHWRPLLPRAIHERPGGPAPALERAQIQSWIDMWSGQVAAEVAADPHKPATTTPAKFQSAVALARRGVQERADFVSRWLACQSSGTGEDKDGDGVIWCLDCRDDNATVYPGAPEICGNNIDDNCNGFYDENCAAPPVMSPNLMGAAP